MLLWWTLVFEISFDFLVGGSFVDIYDLSVYAVSANLISTDSNPPKSIIGLRTLDALELEIPDS